MTTQLLDSLVIGGFWGLILGLIIGIWGIISRIWNKK